MPGARRTPTEATILARILQDDEAMEVHGLARRLITLIRDSGASHPGASQDTRARRAAFDAWLEDAAACAVRAVRTFAAGLAADRAAVIAALTTPWSNARTEGQITRLKLIKRRPSGRAGFELLRRRVLYAP